MIDNSKNKDLTLAYTTSTGIKFYAFENPLSISPQRGIAAELAKVYLDMNITKRSLKELIKQCKIAAGAQDIVKSYSIIQEIEYRLEFLGEDTSILDLANIYFFLEDEDPEQPNEVANRAKHKIFEADQSAKIFFLKIGIALSNKFSGKPEQDILDYLEENRKMSDRIRRYIAEESQLGSTSTSTN